MKFKLEIVDPSKLSEDDLKSLGYPLYGKYSASELFDDNYCPPYVEIDSLESLMNFIDKFGKVIVYKNKIEIYNSWRE